MTNAKPSVENRSTLARSTTRRHAQVNYRAIKKRCLMGGRLPNLGFGKIISLFNWGENTRRHGKLCHSNA